MRVLIAGLCGGSSGIEVYTEALARALTQDGVETVVVTRSRQTHSEVNSKTETLEVQLTAPRKRLQRLLGSLEAAPLHRQIRTIAESAGATLIHATRPQLAPQTDLPLVVTAWDPLTRPLQRARAARSRGDRPGRELVYALTDGLASRRASGIVAVTGSVQQAIGYLPKPVMHIDAFLDDDAILAKNDDARNGCVMVAGRLDHRRKGLGLAIAAVGQARRTTPDLRLILVGGWADPGIEHNLPSFCDVLGRLPRAEVSDVLQSAACCLLPSAWEEFSYVGLEALAAGAPLVTGPLPAFVDLGPAEGVVVARRDPGEFAEGILAAIGIGSFSFPDRFRASTAISKIRQLYEQVLPA